MTYKESQLPVPLGSIVAGRYRVERIIGVGGMGVVMAATHLQLEQPVAIKFLLPDALASSDVVARFLREARSAVRIRSEHVARVLDVGALESGAPYMVMERLEGRDLAELLRLKVQFSIETAVDYLLQTLEAVGEAHSLGIVHRDLKPANLFLVSRRRAEVVKVLDFGISKTTSTTDSAGAGMTHTSAVFGTPAYMSPEQLNSARDVDARADIWSLGIILYEFLAGWAPFRADTIPQLCVAIMNHPTPDLRAIRRDAPGGLEAVIRRCLEKERSQRFSSAEELALALAEYAPARSRPIIDRLRQEESVFGSHRSDGAGGTVSLHPQAFLREGAEPVSPTTRSEWGGTARGVRGRPGRWLLAAGLGGAGLTLAGAIGTRFWAKHDEPVAEPQLAVEMGSARPASSAGGRLARPGAEANATSPELSQPVVASTPASASASASVLEESPASRKSPLEKSQRTGKMPPGGTAPRIAPTSSARAPERRPGSPERWEDER
jgi:serine/threonine protein kinase